jgi:ubiquinone/menaquinone biosynthesis C-methylase UbiE
METSTKIPPAAGHDRAIPEEFSRMLRSPRSGRALVLRDGKLVTADGGESYAISASGIPLFADHFISDAARQQQSHYDGMVASYVDNLEYPHTRAYMAYLDEKLIEALPAAGLGTVAELCCGRGEAVRLLGERMDRVIGVDVSVGLLGLARSELPDRRFFFVQGDATRLPLADACVDNVVMLGGIHHVPDRAALFREVWRILRPGGGFYFREPADDFFLWRAIRRVVYRVSPLLDHNTEAPLRRESTSSQLRAARLGLERWSTCGFLGFCVFMNSDVLVFNRLFRFVPGIGAITRMACWVDDWTVRMPGFADAGLQVIGCARKEPA